MVAAGLLLLPIWGGPMAKRRIKPEDEPEARTEEEQEVGRAMVNAIAREYGLGEPVWPVGNGA